MLFSIALVMTLVCSTARADSVSIQTVRPSLNTSWVLLEDARMEDGAQAVEGRRQLVAGAQYGVVNNPLIEYEPNRTDVASVLVDSLHTLDLFGTLFIANDLAVGASLPLNVTNFGTASGNRTGSHVAAGDLRIQGKYRLPRFMDAPIELAVIPELYIPLGSRTYLLSNASLGAGLLLAGEMDVSMVRLVANIGYRYQPGASYRQIDYTNQLPLGLGAQLSFYPGWTAELELQRAVTLPSSATNNPSELYFGGRYQWSRDLVLASGVSLPTIFTGGSGDFRFILNGKYALGF